MQNDLAEHKASDDLKRLIEADDFSKDFNRSSFQFTHNLADNFLFSLPRLAQLAERLLQDKKNRSVRWQSSDSPVSAGWSVPIKQEMDSLNAAISNLNKSGSWILLYSVQRDPLYNYLLGKLMDEIVALTGIDPADITWQDAYVFMASPGAVTPFHIDHEATFLFQIHGARSANIWSAEDPAVIPDIEVENYYMGDLNAAKYRPENQSKAAVYDLRMGTGVHHPSRAAHAFKNGDDYSIALGVHFCTRQLDRQAKVYQVNHLLRSCGLKPMIPGQSKWRDDAKVGLINLFEKRNPKNKNDLLRSGIQRLTWPARALKKTVRLAS
jgi:hypothetical protein